MLTRLSWRTRAVNLLTHRHAITRTWVVMYPCTFKFNVWHLNTCDHPIEIYISAFHLRHLYISTRLVKATHNIKISLIKQCYIWYAWTGANNAADADMLLILLCCWYWYATDIVILILLVCMLYTTCSMFCAWPVYISLLYHAEIMQLLNHVFLKLNKSNILSNTLKSFKT
jgi:hypothetical protein